MKKFSIIKVSDTYDVEDIRNCQAIAFIALMIATVMVFVADLVGTI